MLHAWKVGEAPDYVIQNVCRKCFQNCYNISISTNIVMDNEIMNRDVARDRHMKFGDNHRDAPVSKEAGRKC